MDKGERADEQLTSVDKVHPVYDKKGFKGYLNKAADQRFLAQFKQDATEEYLKEMQNSSQKLLYRYDRDNSERQYRREARAIIKEMGVNPKEINRSEMRIAEQPPQISTISEVK